MFVPVAKRHEFFAHFVAWGFLYKEIPNGVTATRLRKAAPKILRNDDLWEDVVLRHSGLDRTPIEISLDDWEVYLHCKGNFWGMVAEIVLR